MDTPQESFCTRHCVTLNLMEAQVLFSDAYKRVPGVIPVALACAIKHGTTDSANTAFPDSQLIQVMHECALLPLQYSTCPCLVLSKRTVQLFCFAFWDLIMTCITGCRLSRCMTISIENVTNKWLYNNGVPIAFIHIFHFLCLPVSQRGKCLHSDIWYTKHWCSHVGLLNPWQSRRYTFIHHLLMRWEEPCRQTHR